MEPVLTAVPALLTAEDASTADLVILARGGDTAAFGDLVESQWPDLVSLARAVLAGSGDAEDVVQDACVVAWQRLADLRDPTRFSAWLRRSVVRRCWRLERRRRRETPLEGVDREVPPHGDGLDMPRLLRYLTPRQRAVIYLTMVEGQVDSEIGRQLGMLPATVRVHRHLALQKLRPLVGRSTNEASHK